jgi:hypothetical protein
MLRHIVRSKPNSIGIPCSDAGHPTQSRSLLDNDLPMRLAKETAPRPPKKPTHPPPLAIKNAKPGWPAKSGQALRQKARY